MSVQNTMSIIHLTAFGPILFTHHSPYLSLGGLVWVALVPVVIVIVLAAHRGGSLRIPGIAKIADGLA